MQNYNLGARGSVEFVPGPGGGIPNIVNLSDLQNFQVNWDQYEATTNSLYDSASYPAAGITTISFFQTPIGQGTGFGGGVKTLSDTNMRAAGQLPNGVLFIVSSLELDFQYSTPTPAGNADLPSTFGAGAVVNPINDSYIFWRSGNLVFQVLAKHYVEEAPNSRFGPTTGFTVEGALSNATTPAAGLATTIANAGVWGGPYVLTPNNILLVNNQNFVVTLAWPEGLQPIAHPARVFARLNGVMFRLAQ
jgi:hypothetical protein